MRLIDAQRCPYCARVRIALAEKQLAYETVEIDLSDRPAWVYELNAVGRVPILDDECVLPESEVIMEYLEERYPEVPLLVGDAVARARARLLVQRFDTNLGDDYYAFRRGDSNELEAKLGGPRGGRKPVRRHRVRAVGDPGSRHAWRRAAEAARRLARRARAAPVGRRRDRNRALAVSDIELGELAARLGSVSIVDVRTPHEYDGSFGQPCDPRQGHIPGALHLEVGRLMQLEPAQIETELSVDPGMEIVAYCHSGSRSAVATQILRSLGYDARNYVGSWHEWSRHDELPLET